MRTSGKIIPPVLLCLSVILHCQTLFAEAVFARVTNTLHWSELKLLNEDGTPFTHDPTTITEVTLTLQDKKATVTIDRDLQLETLRTVTGQSGDLGVVLGTGIFSVNTIDDSASEGKTFLDLPFGGAAIIAGSDTTLNRIGTGTLTIAAEKRATILPPGRTENRHEWEGKLILDRKGFIRFSGTEVRDAIPYSNFSKFYPENGTNILGTVILDAPFSMEDASPHKDDITYRFDSNFRLACKTFRGGSANPSRQLILQSGGEVLVTGEEPPSDQEGMASFGLGFYRYSDATYRLSGGALIVTNTAIQLGFDGVGVLEVSGKGKIVTTGIYGNYRRQLKRSLTISNGGILALGAYGMNLTGLCTLTLDGGTIETLDRTTISTIYNQFYVGGENTFICNHDLELKAVNYKGNGSFRKKGQADLRIFTAGLYLSKLTIEEGSVTYADGGRGFHDTKATIEVLGGTRLSQGNLSKIEWKSPLCLHENAVLETEIIPGVIAHQLKLSKGAILKLIIPGEQTTSPQEGESQETAEQSGFSVGSLTLPPEGKVIVHPVGKLPSGGVPLVLFTAKTDLPADAGEHFELDTRDINISTCKLKVEGKQLVLIHSQSLLILN